MGRAFKKNAPSDGRCSIPCDGQDKTYPVCIPMATPRVVSYCCQLTWRDMLRPAKGKVSIRQ